MRRVLAVFDGDKVRKISTLALTPVACKLQVREAIRKGSPFAAELAVVLLESNMESVVSAVQICKGSPVTGKLAPLERDRILASVAWRADAAPIRACVLRAVPSLEYLVERVTTLLRELAGG